MRPCFSRVRPRLEILEDRLTPSVTNFLDEQFDADLNQWDDLSTAISWGGHVDGSGNPTAVSAFAYNDVPNSTANRELSLSSEAISWTGIGANKLNSFTALDHQFARAIDHHTETVTIDFRARWDALTNSGEHGRFMVVLTHDYPVGGLDLDLNERLSDFSDQWWARPSYEFRIRNTTQNHTPSFIMYGGGNDDLGEFERNTDGTGVSRWLPGFVSGLKFDSLGNPITTSPGNGAAYPASNWVATTPSQAAKTTYVVYRYVIRPDVMEVWWDPTGTRENNALSDMTGFTQIAGMALPLTGTGPRYHYYDQFEGIRLYWAGFGANMQAHVDWLKVQVESPGNAAPMVAVPASAVPAGDLRSATLSVLGADDGGESNLTYTWSVTSAPVGAPAVSFSGNGDNAAQNVTATFYQAGSYTLQVTISDYQFSVTNDVAVQVDQALTSAAVTPDVISLEDGTSQQFSAAAFDQFSNPLAEQPAIVWSLDAGSVGSITATGLYTAPSLVEGSATARATVGTVSASDTFNVVVPVAAGILAEFFDFTSSLSVIPNLTGLTPGVFRYDTNVNYPSTSNPWTGLTSGYANTFASRHTGLLRIVTPGNHNLYLNSDDGSRLYVDNVLRINNDGLHGMRERSATVNLTAGYHAIHIEFFENTGGAGLIFSWAGPGFSKQVVPAASLFHRVTGGATLLASTAPRASMPLFAFSSLSTDEPTDPASAGSRTNPKQTLSPQTTPTIRDKPLPLVDGPAKKESDKADLELFAGEVDWRGL